MDWSRAKTLLIIAFLLLDLFLGHEVYKVRVLGEPASSRADATADATRDLLELWGIRVEIPLPETAPNVAVLYVRSPYDLGAVRAGGKQVWEYQGLLLAVWKRALRVTSPRPDAVAERLADEVFRFPEYRYDPVQSLGSRHVFVQTVNNLPLFDVTVEATVENGVLRGYVQRYAEVRQMGLAYPAVPPQAALFTLVRNGLLPPGAVVRHVELGYTGYPTGSEEQALLPVWRILASGRVYYVNAITGGIERPPSLERASLLLK